MTRINVVPVEELTRQHLQGEYKEIVRVFGLVRKRIAKGVNKYNVKSRVKIPDQYVLGTGHVTFFYDKLGYIIKRYGELTSEMRKRGYSPNPIPEHELIKGIDKFWFGEYSPTKDALKLNRQRISERLNK